MIEHITKYMDYLKKHHNLQVTFHDKSGLLSPYMSELATYNIHSNPYCLCVKSTKNSWDICCQKQNNVYKKCEDGAFFGMCYAGVEEFIVPFSFDEQICGFVSVSGYKKDISGAQSRLIAVSNEYNIDRNLLLSLYEKHLSSNIPDMDFVLTLVTPLCAMLSLLCARTSKMYPSQIYAGEANYIYGHILVYLRKNYSDKITLDELSRVCHCSKSYVSHIFKKHSGCSISSYTNMIRLDESCVLLKNTQLSINEISGMVGFSDSNYFCNSFRARFNMSPKQFRAEHKNKD